MNIRHGNSIAVTSAEGMPGLARSRRPMASAFGARCGTSRSHARMSVNGTSATVSGSANTSRLDPRRSIRPAALGRPPRSTRTRRASSATCSGEPKDQQAGRRSIRSRRGRRRCDPEVRDLQLEREEVVRPDESQGSGRSAREQDAARAALDPRRSAPPSPAPTSPPPRLYHVVLIGRARPPALATVPRPCLPLASIVCSPLQIPDSDSTRLHGSDRCPRLRCGGQPHHPL